MQLQTRFDIGQLVTLVDAGHRGRVEEMTVNRLGNIRVAVRYVDHRGREQESRFNEDQLVAAGETPPDDQTTKRGALPARPGPGKRRG